MQNNTPPKEHNNTLIYFGSDVDDFWDILCMHNLMTNYIFLADDLGRIRFAGSGPASEEEVARVIGCATELTSNGKAKKGAKRAVKLRR
jgi:ATPase complex subunit ATP10